MLVIVMKLLDCTRIKYIKLYSVKWLLPLDIFMNKNITKHHFDYPIDNSIKLKLIKYTANTDHFGLSGEFVESRSNPEHLCNYGCCLQISFSN